MSLAQAAGKAFRVGDLSPAFSHDLDQISVGEAVADVPADAQFDDFGVEYPPLNSSHLQPLATLCD
jgi:hypothetical protein